MIGSLWAMALDRLLRAATEIHFIGYSLRLDDARTWWLFRKVAAESRTLRRVFVVDPSEEVVVRTQRALPGLPVERTARSLADFAATLT
jgi:hypothetical protein